MASTVPNLILDTIQKAESYEDLMPSLMQLIPLDEIKQILSKKLDDEKLDLKYCKILSIEQLLPQDIIQYILSFAVNKSVNKNWNKLAKQNEKQQYQRILRHDSPCVKFDSKLNNVFVVNPKRDYLSSIEKELNFKAAYKQIRDLFNDHEGQFSNGDIVIIFEGHQTFPFKRSEGKAYIAINTSISIIGFTKMARLFTDDQVKDLGIGDIFDVGKDEPNVNVYIENVDFDFGGCECMFNMHNKSTLILNQCRLSYDMYGINDKYAVERNVIITKCELVGDTAISISSNEGIGEIVVTDSIIKGIYDYSGCIELGETQGFIDKRMIKLKCHANYFICSIYPILEILTTSNDNNYYYSNKELYKNQTEKYNIYENKWSTKIEYEEENIKMKDNIICLKIVNDDGDLENIKYVI